MSKQLPKAKCPKCGKMKKLELVYDSFWVKDIDNQRWCADCISDAGEEQEQRRIENFYGGSAPMTPEERMAEARKLK